MKSLLVAGGAVGVAERGALWPRWAAAAVWLGVGLSAVHWGTRIWDQRPAAPVPVIAPPALVLDAQQVARALGAGGTAAPEAAAAPTARHKLLGLATDASGHGVALISSDDGPAKPYRLGAQLPDGQYIRRLGAREVGLGASERGPVTGQLALNLTPLP